MSKSTHILLLRGVNVGGRRPVAMEALRRWLSDLKFGRPRTLLQSGNLVVDSARLSGAALEARLEAQARKTLGLEMEIFVRTAEEWSALIAANPCPREAKADPGHFLLMLLKAAPPAENVAALKAAIPGREQAAVRGREAYLFYPDGVGTSRFTLALVERKLGTHGTTRNWNTVTKLAALAAA